MDLAGSTPGERLGDYELLYQLTSGGMGHVYLARKRGTGGFEKLLAIKTIRRELSSRTELRTMFLDEARLLARLEHPAVAQVYDFGEHDETLFLAMEYVAGIRFADLASMGAPPSVVLRLIAEVCRALHAAHELRDLEGKHLEIVHRDVSPDNLMLSFDGHVKVLDFGIALMRGRQAPVTEYGTVKGKPPYLSPEQVKGRRLDRRADLWSVGVVLWELLTGEHLFGGDSIYEVAIAVDEQEIPLPSTLAGQLPDGLDDIVMKALSRDVEGRYESAQDLAEDLEELATSIVAPSLADFASEALKAEREEHRQWLRKVLGGQEVESPAGRPTGMLTVPAEPVAGLAEARTNSDPLAPAGDEQSAGPSGSPTSTGRLAGLLLLALLGGGIWFLMTPKGEGGARELRATDAGPYVSTRPDATARLIVRATTTDATSREPIADATATAADARPRAGRGGERPRRRRPVEPPVPVEPVPVEPSASKGTGTLTIAAEPYALVRVDGVEIGTTPLFNKSFPAGAHEVELIHPDTGTVRLRKTVQLGAGEREKIIAR